MPKKVPVSLRKPPAPVDPTLAERFVRGEHGNPEQSLRAETPSREAAAEAEAPGDGPLVEPWEGVDESPVEALVTVPETLVLRVPLPAPRGEPTEDQRVAREDVQTSERPDVQTSELPRAREPEAERGGSQGARKRVRQGKAEAQERFKVLSRSDGRSLQRLTLYLPHELALRLKVHCVENRRDMSAVVTGLVEDLLGKKKR